MVTRLMNFFSICVLIFLFVSPASAELYKYVDQKGIVHFTDNVSTVPPQYRSQIEGQEETTAPAAEISGDAAESVFEVDTTAESTDASETMSGSVDPTDVDALDEEWDYTADTDDTADSSEAFDFSEEEEFDSEEADPADGSEDFTYAEEPAADADQDAFSADFEASEDVQETGDFSVNVDESGETSSQIPEMPEPDTGMAEESAAVAVDEIAADEEKETYAEDSESARAGSAGEQTIETAAIETEASAIAELKARREDLMNRKNKLQTRFDTLLKEKQQLETLRTSMADEESIQEYNDNVKVLNEKIKAYKEEENGLKAEIEQYNQSIKPASETAASE